MSKFTEALKKMQERGSASQESENSSAAISVLTERFEEKLSTAEKSPVEESGNQRKNPRYECLIPAYASVFFESDVWLGSGSVINLSDQGMLFEFEKTFLKERNISEKASIRARLNLPGRLEGQTIDVEGVVTHKNFEDVTRFGIAFKKHRPEILKKIISS